MFYDNDAGEDVRNMLDFLQNLTWNKLNVFKEAVAGPSGDVIGSEDISASLVVSDVCSFCFLI